MSDGPHGKRDLDVKHSLRYTHLSTGDAQYHDVEKMALVDYKITNNSEEPIEVLLVSQVVDYSSERHDTVTLAPGQNLTCHQLPMLEETSVDKLSINKRTTVRASYKYAGLKHYLPDRSLTLMPYNEIIWLMPHPTEAGSISLFHHIVAWVYDDGDEAVKKAQVAVLEKLEREKKKPGYPQYLNDYNDEKKNPRELVRTIFHWLRYDEKLSYRYRNDLEGTPRGENEISQSVKRSGDTLRDKNGNCIDIAVLCANLIKTIGLDPLIVIKKGHAFVGWKSYSEDVWNALHPDEKRERQEYEFLDTTWTSDSNTNFEDACNAGKSLYDEILANNWLAEPPFNRKGFARKLDIKSLQSELELAKSNAEFFKVMPPPEASSPQTDKPIDLPDNITRLPVPENVSNAAQQRYLRAVFDYITGVEKTLARIQLLENSSDLTENDCKYTLDILQLIHRPDLPEVENISSEDRQWGYRLDALLDSADRLKTSIDTLRVRHMQVNASQGKSPRRSLSSPIISWQYKELLQSTKEIAGGLKIAMTPEENSTKHDALIIEQPEETAINDTPPPTETTGAFEVFYSYVKEDEQLAEKLRKHLVVLKRDELITDWYAGKVVPNQEPSEQIKKDLNSARIILLLISSNYLFSDYHISVEVKRAMERSKAGEAIVMPILLSTTDDLSRTPFGKLQSFPRNLQPIDTWQNVDQALAEIAKEIRAVVTNLKP